MRRFVFLLAATVIIFGASRTVTGQNRIIGAQSFILDDGLPGHIFMIRPPAGMTGPLTYSFPTPPPGNPIAGFVGVGTSGQTLFWNGAAGHNAWEASNVIQNNGSGAGIGGLPYSGSMLEVIDGPKSSNGSPLILESNDGPLSGMMLSISRIVNDHYEINAIEQGGGWKNIVLANSGGNIGIGSSSPASLLSVGSGNEFQVNSSGDITAIRGISYAWPIGQASGANQVLTNDGTGALFWGGPFLPTSGGTVLGNLSMGDNNITNVNDATINGTTTLTTLSANGANPFAGQVATTNSLTQTINNSNVSATGSIILTYDQGTATAGYYPMYITSRVPGVSFTVAFTSAPPAGSFLNYIIVK